MRMIAAALLLAFITTAAAQQPAGPKEYTLTMPAEDINTIGAAINELPAKIANPLTVRLLKQIEAQNEAFRKAHAPEEAGTPATPKEAKP